jgi:hypothetical protein
VYPYIGYYSQAGQEGGLVASFKKGLEGVLTASVTGFRLAGRVCSLTAEELTFVLEDLTNPSKAWSNEFKHVVPVESLLTDEAIANIERAMNESVLFGGSGSTSETDELQAKRDNGEQWIQCLLSAASQIKDDGFEETAHELTEVALLLLEDLETY